MPIMIHIQHFHARLEWSWSLSASEAKDDKLLSDKSVDLVTI